MGGKSRRSGTGSRKLIDRLKAGRTGTKGRSGSSVIKGSKNLGFSPTNKGGKG